jgi:hypothetical protein
MLRTPEVAEATRCRNRSMRFPVFKAFSATIAYLARHWPDLLRALWLPALLLVALQLYAMPPLFAAISAMIGLGDNPEPAEAAAAIGELAKWLFVLTAGSAIAFPMLTVASLAHVIRGDTNRLPFYFRYGGDELRVLAAYLLMSLMIFVISLVGGLAAAVIALLFALIVPAAKAAGSGVGELFVNLVTLWFRLRLCVLYPASIATRRIGFDRAWRATRGNVLLLLGFWVLIGLLLAPVGLVLFALFGGDLAAQIMKMAEIGDDPAALRNALAPIMEEFARIFSRENPSYGLFVAALFLSTIVSTAVTNIAAGIAWRCLTDGSRSAGDDAGSA